MSLNQKTHICQTTAHVGRSKVGTHAGSLPPSNHFLNLSPSRFSRCYVSPDHVKKLASCFEGLLGILMRHEARIVVEGQISFTTKTIKHRNETRVFLVCAPAYEFYDSDVMSRLASGAESVAEHKSQRSFEHCFIGLLQSSLVIKCENFPGRSEFCLCTLQEAVNLSPVYFLWLEFLHAVPTSKTGLLCQTFSRKASFRERRDLNSFGERTT